MFMVRVVLVACLGYVVVAVLVFGLGQHVDYRIKVGGVCTAYLGPGIFMLWSTTPTRKVKAILCIDVECKW